MEGCKGDCCEIPLVNGRGVMRCSREDWEMLKEYRWRLRAGYATMSIYGPGIYAHRLVMDAKKGEEVDHRDRDRLHNCRGNLRLATHGENMRNKGPQKGRGCAYKGVYYDPRLKKYVARIRVDDVTHRLGLFVCAEDAARAYNEAARELFGEFAWLNEIPDRVGVSVGRE